MSRLLKVAATGLMAMLVAVPAFAEQVAAPPIEATMQPMTKGSVPVPRCADCPTPDIVDGNGQRVADRSAPEFPAARRPMMTEPDPSESLIPEVETPQTDALLGGETVLSLPGASLPLPVGLR